jgi:mannosyltransferase
VPGDHARQPSNCVPYRREVTSAPVITAQPLRFVRGSAARRLAWPVVLGLAGFLVSAAGSWNPSYWGDEAASVMSAERSLPSLFRMLGSIDAVHGTYYLLLHFWIDLFGASELSTRLPSAIGIGVATAGTFVLARMLVGRGAAVIAALVFAVLPRVTYMGAEARSTALATAVAVWLVVLLVVLLRSPGRSRRVRAALWSGYAVLLAFGIYLFLYVALLVPALGVAALVLGPADRPARRRLGPWSIATVAGLALAAPVFVAAVSQRDQLAFIGRRAQTGVLDAAVNQWFGNVPAAILAWGLILLAVVLALPRRGWFARVAPVAGFAGLQRHKPTLGVMLAWFVVPSAALLIGTHSITPMYSLRYLSICTPAVAITVGLGIVGLGPVWARATALVLLVALILPSYVDQRGEFAKNDGSDWRQAAAVIQAEARPGDAIVFDESIRPSRKPRLALHLYPAAFSGLNDVTLERPFDTTGSLWDETVPLESVTDALAGTGTVWLVQYLGSTGQEAGTELRTLQRLGYTVASSTRITRTTITELTR